MAITRAKTALIKVMIVDNHEMLRHALVMGLRDFDDMILVGEASSGDEAVELCGKVRPDVVLMDLVMDRIGGVAATRAIRANYPDVQVLIFTSFNHTHLLQAALQAGADSYLLKNVTLDQLSRAIRDTYERGLKASNKTFRD